MLYYEHYFQRLESIQAQSDFGRKAIKQFIESSEPSRTLPTEPEPTVPLSAFLGNDDESAKTIIKYMESVRGGFPEKYKDLENRLAQNEVILIVAVFEDQMKAIHREVLRQNPSLLNPDREVKLGKLIALKEDRVIEDEIESVVQALDRKTVKDRAKAFEKFGLAWGTRAETVEKATLLRNRILHEDTDIEVTGWDLTNARSSAIVLPLQLYIAAEALYPKGFDSGITAEERAIWTKNIKAVLVQT